MSDLSGPKRFFNESDHDFAEFYRKRVRQNRDLVILLTDGSNDRGTGKTTEALRLAHGMDRTDEGITTEKASIDPMPLLDAYVEQPRGSGLVLDETEIGLDKYRAGSAVNKAIRELVSMGRVEEKYLVLNAPADHLVDQDLKSMVDVWILVERRGFASVYRMDWNPFEKHEETPPLGTIEWDPIPKSHDLHSVYQQLTKEKRARLRGEEGDKFITLSEAHEMVEKAKKEATKETRDDIIRQLAKQGIGHKEIGSAVDLSRGRVSQITAEG